LKLYNGDGGMYKTWQCETWGSCNGIVEWNGMSHCVIGFIIPSISRNAAPSSSVQTCFTYSSFEPSWLHGICQKVTVTNLKVRLFHIYKVNSSNSSFYEDKLYHLM